MNPDKRAVKAGRIYWGPFSSYRGKSDAPESAAFGTAGNVTALHS